MPSFANWRRKAAIPKKPVEAPLLVYFPKTASKPHNCSLGRLAGKIDLQKLLMKSFERPSC
jgi:hypothetical protein